MPLYFRQHLKWLDESRQQLRSVDLAAARALPVSFCFGALLPAVIGMLPTWYPRPDELHQNILAAWQPDPVWVSIIQAILVWVLRSNDQSDVKAVWWTRFAYLFAAASSALGHLYTFGSILTSSEPLLTFVRTYVPFLFSGPHGADQKLANGPWLFLQYDLIIISLSCMSWAYILVTRALPANESILRFLPIIFLLGGVVLGPGAVVSLALFWREGALQRVRSAKLVRSDLKK